LDQLGLTAALRQHCERFSRETGVEVRFDAEPGLTFPAAAEVAIFRVVQEALVNVQKHARALRVEIQLRRCGEWLALELRDDGVGFALDGHAGTGIGSMRERVEMLGGTLCLTSHPGEGTELTMRIPYHRR
ncbi:MAG: ATP-binding protein, partial [Chloroflexota bacterium]|nr:ATP-binding protein [Chloroflexota bacterium]